MKDMNMKKRISTFLSGLLVISLMGCSAGTAPSQSASPGTTSNSSVTNVPVELTIAAAASLTAPLNEIIANYSTAAPDVKITPTYGGSGTLQEQIEQGAPIDIFFSAASKQMNALDEAGLIDTATRVDLLQNEIVLVVPADLPVKVGSFNDTATDTVEKIALGDPKSVPAGQYAQDTFTYLNLWDKVSSKATYGSDVKQVLSWVESGNVDCGVVYKTDAITDQNVQIIAEAPNGSHTPIVYPVAVVKAGANQDAAKAFIAYLQSDAAIAVFERYGFLTS
jgi:molybdate transport system substrate-binding protein